MRGFRFPAPIYPIADDRDGSGRDPIALVDAMVRAGAPLLQLRVKNRSVREFVALARAARERTASAGVLLIINDRADVAALVGADGVHLGQDDLPPADARRLLGPRKIVGFSTHSLEQARAAAAERVADYIGFGPVFPTRSKANPDPVVGLDGLAAARRAVALPIVAIGGIRERQVSAVLAAGADAAAMIGDLVGDADVEGKLRRMLTIEKTPTVALPVR